VQDMFVFNGKVSDEDGEVFTVNVAVPLVTDFKKLLQAAVQHQVMKMRAAGLREWPHGRGGMASN